MIEQYDKAVERTAQFQRSALTDFSSVATKMKEIIKKDIEAIRSKSIGLFVLHVGYFRIVKKMYDFLNDKYRNIDIPKRALVNDCFLSFPIPPLW